MAICTFLGHKTVYDRDLYEKLLDAVYMIAEQNAETEFLFYNRGYFYDLCLAAALDARQHFPQKEITITWVVKAEEREGFVERLKRGEAGIPPCVIDRVIAPPPISGSPVSVHKKLDRWAVQRSTHLVSYVYFVFCEAENRQYVYAKSQGLTICDVSSPETAAYLLESVEALPEREGAVLKSAAEGQTQKEIAKRLGVSDSAVQQTLRRACGNLSRAGERRLRNARRQCGAPPVRCAVFALGKVTRESLSAFEQAVLFVRDRYHVTEFRVAAEYCHSGYMSALMRLTKSFSQSVRVVAVTHYPEMTEEAWREAASGFVPPCHAVENIDTQAKRLRAAAVRAAKVMIGQADFCICSLASSPLAGSLEKHISTVRGAKVLDIGKPFPGADIAPPLHSLSKNRRSQ